MVFIPLRRDQLLPGLAAGKGDIAAANLTITPERQKLVGFTVAGLSKADFWKQIFPKLIVHDDVAVRTGGEIAWAFRKGSPQLKAVLDDFATRNKVGTATGNQVLTRYLKNVKYVKNAASERSCSRPKA